jgi:hypothetical protein
MTAVVIIVPIVIAVGSTIKIAGAIVTDRVVGIVILNLNYDPTTASNATAEDMALLLLDIIICIKRVGVLRSAGTNATPPK